MRACARARLRASVPVRRRLGWQTSEQRRLHFSLSRAYARSAQAVQKSERAQGRCAKKPRGLDSSDSG
eukprot:1327295-Pleurochrysis_carterae.AAC.1